MAKERILNMSISKLIDIKFRNYALYVLMNRGIPSFYDSLTPIQRYILMNTPQNFTKTLSVVGRVIEDGYHHGSMSVESSIARLARPYANSHQILEGYGFFGNEVTPEPSAARYTSVKLNSEISNIIKEYHYLHTKTDDHYDPLWIDIPIGLLIPIIGIAVGYKTMILPRKLKDIQDFLNGKRKTVKPYFNNYKGKITKYKNKDNTWLLTANVEIKNKTIKVNNLPPIIKYSSLLNKLQHLLNQYDNKINLINTSDTTINFEIIYKGLKISEFEEIVEYIKKITSIIVTENIVFVKDEQVLVYSNLEEYLEDYKWQIYRLKFENSKYLQNKISFDLEYNKAKKKFITFILQKKRSIDEINTFLKQFNIDISNKLDRLTSKSFSSTELIKVTELIKKLTKELSSIKKETIKLEKEFNKLKDPTEKRGIKSRQSSTFNLFEEDNNEIDGIEIYQEEINSTIEEDI